MTARSSAFAYAQIADELRREIAGGTYAVGARIPAIRELSERFSVSAQTVQKALAELAAEGLLRAGSTRGYFVAAEGDLQPVGQDGRLAELEEALRLLNDRVSLLEDRLGDPRAE